MPRLWQTAESHHEISADSLKACKVPIAQAFHLYRKTHRGRIWPSVKVLTRRCILNTADSPPAKGLGHVPGVGQGPGTQPRSALGQDGAPDAERPPAPSPDRAARRLRQYTFSKLRHRPLSPLLASNSLYVLASPNVIEALTGNTVDVRQKLFGAKQQITRVEKKSYALVK